MKWEGFVQRIAPAHERRNQFIWLTIYSDLITNLLLLFMSLYALSFIGPDALSEAVTSMKSRMEYSKKAAPWYEEITHDLKMVSSPNASVIAREDRLQMSLPDDVLFGIGEGTLKPGQQEALKQLALALSDVPYTILIEGHTDNQPLRSTRRYQSNWELSLARAMAVMNYLVHKGGLSPKRIGVAAFGEFHPRVANDTPDNRALNRRIEISILRYD